MRRLTEGPTLARKILGNSGWLIAERVTKLAAGLGAAVWLARYLGADGFGTFSYIIAFVALFSELTTLGLNGIVTRDLVADRDDSDAILGTAWWTRIVGGLVGLIVMTTAIHFVRPDDATVRALVVVLGAATLFRANEVADLFFQSRLQARIPSFVRMVSTLLYVGLLVGFALADRPLAWFLVARATDLIVMNTGFLVAYRLHGGRLKGWRFEFPRSKRMLRQSWPLVLSGIGASFYLKIDQVMLGDIVGSSAVGVYAAAAQVSEASYFIPIAIMASLFPLLVEARKEDPEQYQRRLQNVFDVFAWMGVGVAAVLSLLAGPLMRTVFGETFAPAGTILAVHVWASVFIYMRAVLSKWLIMEDLFVFSLVTHGAGALVNIAANLVLIPWLGGLGAAIATVASYATASYLALFFHRRTWPAAAMMSKALIAPVRLLAGTLRPRDPFR